MWGKEGFADSREKEEGGYRGNEGEVRCVEKTGHLSSQRWAGGEVGHETMVIIKVSSFTRCAPRRLSLFAPVGPCLTYRSTSRGTEGG